MEVILHEVTMGEGVLALEDLVIFCYENVLIARSMECLELNIGSKLDGFRAAPVQLRVANTISHISIVVNLLAIIPVPAALEHCEAVAIGHHSFVILLTDVGVGEPGRALAVRELVDSGREGWRWARLIWLTRAILVVYAYLGHLDDPDGISSISVSRAVVINTCNVTDVRVLPKVLDNVW